MLLRPGNRYLFKKSPRCSLQRKKGNIKFSETLNWRSAKANSVRCRGLGNKMPCAFGPDVWGKANGTGQSF